MHPEKICEDVQSMGSKLVLDGEDLFIENPDNVYPELVDFIKSYKSRIITYLKGEYSDVLHNRNQTIDKIVDCFLSVEQDINEKINTWLKHDEVSTNMILQLFVELWNNGWRDIKEPIANYQDSTTDELSERIFTNAMSYFRGS